jgi:hypothetical protein
MNEHLWYAYLIKHLKRQYLQCRKHTASLFQICCNNLQDKAGCSSETPVIAYTATRRHKPQHHKRNNHRWETIKKRLVATIWRRHQSISSKPGIHFNTEKGGSLCLRNVGIPPRRPGLKPGSGHVGFCDGQKWRWGRFSPTTSVSPANMHSICFSRIIFAITRGWHNRAGVAAVPLASQTRIKKKNKKKPVGIRLQD